MTADAMLRWSRNVPDERTRNTNAPTVFPVPRERPLCHGVESKYIYEPRQKPIGYGIMESSMLPAVYDDRFYDVATISESYIRHDRALSTEPDCSYRFPLRSLLPVLLIPDDMWVRRLIDVVPTMPFADSPIDWLTDLDSNSDDDADDTNQYDP